MAGVRDLSAIGNPYLCFNISPEVIRLAMVMDVRYPLLRGQVEDFLFERDIYICHETVWFWWNRFDPVFAAEISNTKRRGQQHQYTSRRRTSAGMRHREPGVGDQLCAAPG